MPRKGGIYGKVSIIIALALPVVGAIAVYNYVSRYVAKREQRTYRRVYRSIGC